MSPQGNAYRPHENQNRYNLLPAKHLRARVDLHQRPDRRYPLDHRPPEEGGFTVSLHPVFTSLRSCFRRILSSIFLRGPPLSFGSNGRRHMAKATNHSTMLAKSSA